MQSLLIRCKLFHFNTSITYLKGKSYLSHLSRSDFLLVVQSLFPCHLPSRTRVIQNIWLSNEGCENNTKNSVKTLQNVSKIKDFAIRIFQLLDKSPKWVGGEWGGYVHYGTIQYFEHILRVLKNTREKQCFAISECATHSPLPHPASIFASPQAREL